MRFIFRAQFLSAWLLFVMATQLPTLRKVWQFSANNLINTGSAAGNHRGWMVAAKNAMQAFPSSPWVVVGSADTATAALDGVDRFTAEDGTWIVMRQAGIAANFQLCWTSTEAGSLSNSMFISPSAGFTGGAVGTRPTATDEVAVTSGATGDSPAVAVTGARVSIAMSSDGQCTRIFGLVANATGPNGLLWHFSLIDRLYQPISDLTIPWCAASVSTPHNAQAVTHNAFFNASPILFGRQGSTDLTLQALAPAGWTGGAIDYAGDAANFGNGQNNLSSDLIMAPIAVASRTASNRGVHGELADLWASGDENVANVGDTYPEATFVGDLDQFIQIGSALIHPWNNTVPQLGGIRTRRQGRVLFYVQTLSSPEEDDVPIIHTAGFGGSTGADLATASPIYTSGDVWFVHSGTGTDAASPAGKSREQPLATLAQAQTNAAAGDVIVMLSGHSETLSSKLTLSKAGLVLLGEGSGTSRPTFNRSADVNLWDLTGAAIRVENIRFNSDAASTYTADRVLVTANSCIFRGCYFVSGANDAATPALAVASGVTNLRIDGATYFVASGTSRTATGYRGLALNGTTTDLELDDVIFDGGSYGWLSNALNAAGAASRLRGLNVDLLNGADIVLASSTTGLLHVRHESGAARVVWP